MSLQDYIQNKPNLHTKRLLIRPMTKADIPSLIEWMPDKGIYQYWGKGPGKSDKEPALLFQKEDKPTKSFHWGIECTASKKVIGEIWIYLIEKDRMAKVAFRLGAPYHGQGYGTEALHEVVKFCFEHTELLRLWTDVDVRNAASCKVLENCGFLKEGHIRQGKMVSTWCDYYLYGMLREDYEKH